MHGNSTCNHCPYVARRVAEMGYSHTFAEASMDFLLESRDL